MIVSAVGKALRTAKAATLSQLVADLGADRDMIEAAVEFWLRRGNVVVCEQPADGGCGTVCRRCPIADAPSPSRGATVYEWR